MIKITAGKFRNTQLQVIPKIVRPTSSFKREAFFSIIESFGLKESFNFYYKKTFLDLFSGIGTMGLEAVSRGCSQVIFYEKNLEVIKILEQNCKKICKDGQYFIKKEDILYSKLDIDFEPISLIYIDPPYDQYNINLLLDILKDKIKKDTIIGVESSLNFSFKVPTKLNLIKQKKYGITNLSFLMLS